MKLRIFLVALLIALLGVVAWVFTRNDGVWELRVERNGKVTYFRGFQSEEDCYAFYEANRRNKENPVHGCYPVR